ncbi:hypothetical protein [Brevibacillus sp. NRS-1366]|uniref:hypothetical protein n=1 Tax=Brevibacillus sp. NRS-1366 TaxID=3233899 RepID=UPI003D203BB7
MERKLLGQVGVDSGQMVIIDPCYIESEWQGKESVLGVDFWGQGQEKILSLLKGDGIHVERIGGKCRVMTNDAEAMIKRIKFLSEDIKQKVMAVPYTDSTYDKVCDITLTEDQGGQLNYKMGHAGLGVAFNSGLGDGTYNVYATYKDIEGWGRRIVKVEIELLDDEYLEDINERFGNK